MGLRLFRKFVKFIRGGAMPWQVAASFLIGTGIGMVPGFNLTVVLLILVFVLLNLNLGLMLLGLMLGKALCLTLAPVTYRVGFFIIHDLGLEGLFRAVSQTPILAWMDLHYYCLVGGIPVTLVVGGGVGIVLGRMIAATRAAIAARGEKSERLQRLSRNVFLKLMMRLLFGKQKRALAEMSQWHPPVFRKGGVIVCVVLVVLIFGGQWLLADFLATSGVVRGLEAATGAEVNVERVDISPLTGRFSLEGLQVTDPDKPTHNMVQINALTTDLSFTDLLARRFVINEMRIDRLRTDTLREKPGQVYVKPDEPDPPITEDTVSEYFKDGRKVLDYLRKAKEYLDRRAEAQRRRDEEVSPEDLRRLAELQGYLRLSAREVLAQRPWMTIRLLTIGEIPAGEVDTYRVEGHELSANPELHDQPMRLKVTSSRGMDAEVVFDFADPGAVHQLRAVVPDLPVGQGGPIQLSEDNPVQLQSATVDIRAAGTFSRDAINLPVELKVRDLQADARDRVLGMDAATAQRVFEHLQSASVILALEGPLTAPRVRIDASRTLQSMRQGLRGAAADELSRQIGRRLEGLVDERGVRLPDTLPSFGEGLFRRPVPQPEEDREKEDAPPAPGPADRLRDLLR